VGATQISTSEENHFCVMLMMQLRFGLLKNMIVREDLKELTSRQLSFAIFLSKNRTREFVSTRPVKTSKPALKLGA
jgi:hypothetical protein